ncbi:MAG: DUF3224 domain-containing protein [Rhodothermia bacterium]|nr:DUF3224 domain-containing protein [Rhodothermia bacterium]
MPQIAIGTFEVKMTPIEQEKEVSGRTVGLVQLEKTFHGDLQATGVGKMLTSLTATKGSAVYTAIEKVEGNLHGKAGSLVFHHQGIMEKGAQHLTIAVVPDSGEGEWHGIRGTFFLEIVEKVHHYRFEYDLG